MCRPMRFRLRRPSARSCSAAFLGAGRTPGLTTSTAQPVTIAATDEDGGVTQVTFDLTVNNVNPTLTVAKGR